MLFVSFVAETADDDEGEEEAEPVLLAFVVEADVADERSAEPLML